MTYPIVAIPEDAPAQLEQLGTKNKFWYWDENDQRMMFKCGRPGTGENWAEKVCCEICRLLDIPHAEYELAVWKDQSGVVTPTFVPKGGRLVLGNELLARIVDDYDRTARFRARQHTVRTVMAVASFKEIAFPRDWNPPESITVAAGVFVGYLMLDALVSNQDRHHENWGVILMPEEGVFFAPTFDHASSLGRNETDYARNDRLTTKDKGRSVEAYVRRAKSAFYATYSDTMPLTTLEAFREAAKIRTEAADYWRGQLSDINMGDYRKILAEIPDTEISAPARDFAVRMIEINANRILQTSL
jgi:hypothetical protein